MDNFDPILDAPIIPGKDWPTDEEVFAFEIEEFSKIAKVAMNEINPLDIKEKRKREEQMVHDFKKNPGQETFIPLYNAFKPMIIGATQRNMFGSPLPRAAHMAYAAQSFLDSTRTWDPSKGPFHTHMYGTVLEKGKRLNLKYQNIGYIPESRATKYQAYNTSLHLLREALGREPSTLELADDLNLPPSEIERMRKEVRQDRLMSENLPTVGAAFAQSDKALQVAKDIQYSLIPKHALVLEHALGLNGNKALIKKNGGADVGAIAKAAKISIPEVRSAFKTITRKFKEYRGTIGQNNHFDDLADDEHE